MHGHIHLGDLPTRLAGGGTIGALWFTAVTFRRDQDSRAKDEARHVSAWIGTITAVADSPEWFLTTDLGPMATLPDQRVIVAGNHAAVIIRNGANEPVYEVEAKWACDDSDSGKVAVSLIPPGTTKEVAIQPAVEKGTLAIRSLVFSDAAGKRWRRNAQGRLSPVKVED